MLNVVVTATGPLFTLEEAKAHLRVEHSDDDDLIDLYSEAAVSAVLQYCNLPVVPEGDLPLPAFKAAALIVLGFLYANPEGDDLDGVQLPSASRILVNPYRWLRV